MTRLRMEAINRVIEACRDPGGGRNLWAGVRAVESGIEELARRQDGPLAPPVHARIERSLHNAIDDIEQGYTGEARTELVDAMEVILEVTGALAELTAARGVPSVTELAVLAPGRWSVVLLGRRSGSQVVVKIPRSRTPGPAEAPADTIALVAVTGSTPPWDITPAEALRKHTEALVALDDPLFVEVLQHGETPAGVPYLVLPYLDGGSLRTAMRSGAAPGPAFFAEIARGLARLRGSGVLPTHGDLKPDNVLLDAGRPRLIDPAVIELDEYGQPLRYQYTPLYGPGGRPNDVAALALMAVEAATGAHPFLDPDLAGRRERPVGPTLGYAMPMLVMRQVQLAQIARIRLPSERGARAPWDELLLSALGFVLTGETLDVRPGDPLTLLELADRLDRLAPA